MSKYNLGLTEQQLSFLAFFEEKKREIFFPRDEVFRSQRQHLTQCTTLIEQLEKAWATIKNESEDFNGHFPTFMEAKLSQIALHIDNWCDTKQTLDRTVAECSKVYISSDILYTTKLIAPKKKKIDTYRLSLKQYLELCAIEREILEAYSASKRDYRKIADIIGRYQRLPLDIRNFIREEPQRMLIELTNKLDILNRFNDSMDKLGARYAQLPNSVRTGTLVFRYSSLDDIQKNMAKATDFQSGFQKLAAWVDGLSESDRAMLVGANRVAASRGDYQTYGTCAANIQELLDESKNFYKGAKICGMIEDLSKKTARKMQDINNVRNAYRALPPAAAKYVDEKMLALLNSMENSINLLAQMEGELQTLEAAYRELNNGVKVGVINYSYEKFATVRATLLQAQEWMGSYNELNRMFLSAPSNSDLNAIKKRMSAVSSDAIKVKAAANELPKIEKAYEFETALIGEHITLDSEEATILNYKEKLDTLPTDVRAYISEKWKDLLSRAKSYRSDLKQIQSRIDALLKECKETAAKLQTPSYESFYAYAEASKRGNDLAAMCRRLIQDISEFKNKYKCTDDFSATELGKHEKLFKESAVISAEIESTKALYNLAKRVNKGGQAGYADSELEKMLHQFESQKTQYPKYDTTKEIEKAYETIQREIRWRKEKTAAAAAAKRKAAQRKKTISTVFLCFSIVAVVCMGVVLARNLNTGSFWRWLLVTAAAAVFSICLIRKASDSKGICVFVTSVCIALLCTAIALHFFVAERRAWYVPLFIATVVIMAVLQANIRDSSVTFVGIYTVLVILFCVGLLIFLVYTWLSTATYLDKTFFGQIGNCFIALWRILVAIFGFVLEIIRFTIAWAYWGDSETAEVVLNTAWYSLIAGWITSACISAAKDE